MTLTAQNRAIKNYRTRLRKQGLARFEVKALASDRDLLRVNILNPLRPSNEP